MREVRVSMFPDKPLIVDDSEYENLKALGIVRESEENSEEVSPVEVEEVSPVVEEKKLAPKPPMKKAKY